MIKGILFDLDGVIVSTDKLHFQAWKQSVKKLNINLDVETNEKLKGVSRENSLALILKSNDIVISQKEFNEILVEKNSYYLSLLEKLNKEAILPGIEQLLVYLSTKGIKIAIASASLNAPAILKKLDLYRYVDFIADPRNLKPKPNSEIFLNAMNGINLIESEVIGIEDSQAGIDALRDAQIYAIGIGTNLDNANQTIETTNELMDKIKDVIAMYYDKEN